MNLEELKVRVRELEEAYRSEFINISDFVFNTPELSGEEYISSKYVAEAVKAHGFDVEFPYEDIPTAFIASFENGDGPTVAFLAEYDALPGYETESGNGHACGHNWIASTMSGCAVVLSKLKEEFKGTVMLIGTPAEETYGAKVDMAERGAFDKVDVIFQSHLESETVIDTAALAMSSLQFEFTGRAAHAASFPEEGINALDAVQITFMGVNSLRQHVRQDVRIHGIITEGGLATNIVPAKAVCKISMRSRDKKYLEHVVSRVVDCAKGAAMITGAKVEYHNFENTFYDLVNVPTLMDIMKKNMMEEGITKYSSQEDAPPPGSTDIGNVSYKCPTMYVEVDIEADKPMKSHEAEALEYVNSEYAYKKMTQMINATVCSALELYKDSEKLEKIKLEHREIVNR